jgi:hypothetical protein
MTHTVKVITVRLKLTGTEGAVPKNRRSQQGFAPEATGERGGKRGREEGIMEGRE